eukprot:5459675-Prorocentrum_lima.AAC.1
MTTDQRSCTFHCPKCPHVLQEYKQLVFTINKHKVSAVIKREFDNMSPVQINIYHKEFADAKLA